AGVVGRDEPEPEPLAPAATADLPLTTTGAEARALASAAAQPDGASAHTSGIPSADPPCACSADVRGSVMPAPFRAIKMPDPGSPPTGAPPPQLLVVSSSGGSDDAPVLPSQQLLAPAPSHARSAS